MGLFKCHECALGEKSNGVSGKYLSDAPGQQRNIMIISDCPHDDDAFTGTYFVGKHANNFFGLLKESGYSPKDIYLTGLVKCTPFLFTPNQNAVNKETILKKDSIVACSARLIEELVNIEPKYLILFGEKTFSYFFPKLSFSDNRGKILHNDEYDADCIATYNPISMAYTNKFDRIIKTDMTYMAEHIYGSKDGNTVKIQKDYRFPLQDLSLLEALNKRLKEVETFACDIETHGTGLFNYKLLSIGFSYKEHTGVSVPVWVRDDQKVDALKLVEQYKIPARHIETVIGTLKNGKPKIKKTADKGFKDEDREIIKSILPEEYAYLATLPTLKDIKQRIRAILDKEPPLKKYWGANHDRCMALIKEIMENDTPKGFHNGGYDVNRLRGIGINVKNYAWDTILMHHLLDEERPHKLDDLSFVYTKDGGYKSEKNVYIKNESKTSWANIPPEVLLPYNAQDADVTLQLYHIFKPELQKQGRLWHLFETQVMPAQRILIDMSFRGSNVDLEWLNKTQAEYRKKMNDLVLDFQDLLRMKMPNAYVVANKEEESEYLAQVKAESGSSPVYEIVNLNSTAHMVHVFRDLYGIKDLKKTATGDSLDANALKRIAKKNKLADILLDYKELTKLDGTYLTGIKNGIDADGKIHGEFLVYGTTSGRLSSKNPNCFDNQTEVLTKTGFKLFKDLKNTDLVAQWNDGEITFAKPLSYIKNKYKGKLVRVHNQHIDICGTPDHRCLLLNRSNTEKVFPLSDYKEDHKQLHGGYYNKGTLNIPEWELRLLVATQADGYYTGNAIEFNFHKKRKIQRFTEIISKLNIPAKPKPKSDGGTRFYLSSKLSVVKWIRSIMPIKEFPYELLNLSSECRELFLDELNHWDGAYTRPLMYCSRSKQNVDIVQTLLALNNRRSCYRERSLPRCGDFRTYYYVDSTATYNYSWTTNIEREEVSYDDYVYCVTMPKDTVIIRRNGCVVVTKNCQNIPADMKTMFVPPPGYLCVNVDQSAAELHVMAYMAQDHVMMNAFEQKKDLHNFTACGIFNKKPEEITHDERQIGKKINFMSAYAVSGPGLADQLRNEGVKITDAQADKYLEKWRTHYRGCSRFLEMTVKVYKQRGYLETPFGRRRHKYKVFADRSKEESTARTAQNFTIQSTASDIQIKEMVEMYPTLIEHDVWPVFTVHDSITMWVRPENLEWLRSFYKEKTCRRFTNDELPGINNCLMVTEMEVGRNYGEHIKLPYDVDFQKWKEENHFLFDNSDKA